MSSTESNYPIATPDRSGSQADEFRQIQDALRGLRFGTVSIIVQDGVIVQIDRTEKRRLRRSGKAADATNCC